MSYDSTVPTDLDLVRLLIDDRAFNESLTDGEIDRMLVIETATGKAKPWFTAARCLSILHTSYVSLGGGLTRRDILDHEEEFGDRGSTNETLAQKITELKTRGAELLSSARGGSVVMRVTV